MENAVQKLFDAASKDEQLRARLHLQGSITFENHTNLGDNVDDIAASVEQLALVRDGTNTTTQAPKRAQKAKRGKSGPADQFCIYRRSDGQNYKSNIRLPSSLLLLESNRHSHNSFIYPDLTRRMMLCWPKLFCIFLSLSVHNSVMLLSGKLLGSRPLMFAITCPRSWTWSVNRSFRHPTGSSIGP
ncbi:hypothetical protein F5Y17DRAFT_452467 [Xylariaceae sp. FL0594]|nr:hypothetical protein F5Y17DRAFT_452467 [Xylariaceae sp. FL0594]